MRGVEIMAAAMWDARYAVAGNRFGWHQTPTFEQVSETRLMEIALNALRDFDEGGRVASLENWIDILLGETK